MDAIRFNRTIEEMQEVAVERGGRCLSEVYLGSITHLEWECAEGHRWRAIPNNVRRGGWCPICARRRRGGKAFSVTTESNGESKPRSTVGGQRPASVLGCGRRRRSKQQLAADLLRIVEERGGRCLTIAFDSREAVLRLECAEGHLWQTRVGSILDGHWCHVCGRRSMEAAYKARFGLLDLDDADEVALWAESQGLTFVQNGKPRVGRNDFFRCETGHLWEVPRALSMLGSWCPVCGARGEGMGLGRGVR